MRLRSADHEPRNRWSGGVDTKYPHEQVEYDGFLRRWRDHAHRSFPSGWAGRVVAGVDLVLFDPDLGSLLNKYAEKRQLSEGAVKVLQQHCDELGRALPFLDGDATDYFSELYELAEAVLRMVRQNAPND